MIGIVDWAAERARMVLAFIAISVAAGTFAYVTLPKEGEPDIDIPVVYVSVSYPGISAADSEKLLVKPMESELSSLDGLDTMRGIASENHAGMVMEFDFGWNQQEVMSDIRDAMNAAEANFPTGAQRYTLTELNFSGFPIIIVNLTGDVPERTMTRLANEMKDRIEPIEAVLEVVLTGGRDEMVEVIIDPLRLESYNITAAELIGVFQKNNQLIAAGEVETESGAFSVKIPSSFDEIGDVYDLPIKTNGDRVITLSDIAELNLTYEDRTQTARFNGESTIALQVSKRKGFNIIDTADLIEKTVMELAQKWPEEVHATVQVGTSNNQSITVGSMVSQLENSVLTAIALVMIVTLAILGLRPALLVGFAIPTSFLLCFALLAAMGVAISNIVMFGLILAVGMLVDGAIVVVEYADKRISQGVGPMRAYVAAAKRMFWPVVSSTATTLCAFLPMLFWPGLTGEFMGMLPVTLIFVLSASLLVALVYLPVMGGVTGRVGNWWDTVVLRLASIKLKWHLLLFPVCIAAIAFAAIVNPLVNLIRGIFESVDKTSLFGSIIPTLVGGFLLVLVIVAAAAVAVVGAAGLVFGAAAAFRRIKDLFLKRHDDDAEAGPREYKRSLFGRVISLITANPIGPLVSCCFVFVFVGSVAFYYQANNRGVEFFVEVEPQTTLVYVRARGNLSIEQKDELVRQTEEIVLAHPNVDTVFAFAGGGGLSANLSGQSPPEDSVGQLQVELKQWEDRPKVRETWFTIPIIGYPVRRDISDPQTRGQYTMDQIVEQLEEIPGIQIDTLALDLGPAAPRDLHLRIRSNNWEKLIAFTQRARAKFENTEAVIKVEDTMPLPGIDWQIDVDVEKAGRYGADVATVGAMVQLVTRGVLLDTMRLPNSDDEVDIRARLPQGSRVLSTLDDLKVRTRDGLVPLSNFITRKPVVRESKFERVDQARYFDILAFVEKGKTKTVRDASGKTREVPINGDERTATLTEWLEAEAPAAGVEFTWQGDAQDREESADFLGKAFGGALGLMFVILLAQFNSIYNSVLVLTAVILSTAGVLIGMMVMNQPFSIIMTGTGVVALAGIVVNNNIVLIDTYQEYCREMHRIEAIIRTAEARIRPVLLTSVTTMAGLSPMMFGVSLDFFQGGYTVDSPTALWWKQLATAVVFGLGIATVLTLMFTPSMLALRHWATTYAMWAAWIAERMALEGASRRARDWAEGREAHRKARGDIPPDGGDGGGTPSGQPPAKDGPVPAE